MLDALAMTPGDSLVSHQRMRGEAHAGFRLRNGKTVLRDLRQVGSAKALLPRCHAANPEVVFLNTAGGLTGGDHLSLSVTAEPGTSVIATTQTAERAYASNQGAARLDVDLKVGNGARVAWLPQETILFDHSSIARRTVVDLEGDATLLMAETVVLGRTAMGETLSQASLIDRREIRRDGRLVVLDPMKLSTHVLDRRNNPCLLRGALATSTIYFVAPQAEDRVMGVRRVLDRYPQVDAGVSGWDAKLIVRALSRDAQALRRLVADCLMHISGEDLPRVWQQ